MKIVGTGKLFDFCARRPSLRPRVAAWLAELDEADLGSQMQTEKRYASARFLAPNVAVFHFGGEEMVVEVLISFSHSTLLVKWVGSSADYTEQKQTRH